MYKHCKTNISIIKKADNSNSDEIKSLTVEIDTLKSQIDKIKEENNDKLNTITKIYMMEFKEVQEENNILRDDYNSFVASENQEMKDAEAENYDRFK